VNTLTTKLMIENRQSSEKVLAGLRQTVRFGGRVVSSAGLVLHMRIA
jgi:hypothetical protein